MNGNSTRLPIAVAPGNGRVTLFSLLVAVIFVGAMRAAVIEVHPGMSIQQAVNASSDCDTVLLFNGVYVETVIPYGKTITIGSLYLLDNDTTHIASTVITPDVVHPDTQSCIVYAYGEQAGSRLKGLTLAGGTGTLWNVANAPAGGAIHICSSAVAIENCVIENGNSPFGGGIGLLHRQNHQPISSLEMIGCTVRNCTCSNWGGGLYAISSALMLLNCTFEANSSDFGAGGVQLISECVINVELCTFRDNIGDTGGTDLGANSGILRNCLFDGNGVNVGVGLVVSHLNAGGNELSIHRNIFRSNTLGNIGVLLAEFGEWGMTNFFGNVLENNVTTQLTGTLGLASSNSTIAYNVFRNNLNSAGGAIYAVDGGIPHIHHNWFEGNASNRDTCGSVLQCMNGASPFLDSNAFVGNVGQTITRWEYPGWNPAILAQNNWWGHPSGPYHPVLNPFGQGDTLLDDSIHFIPWLTEPPDTTQPQDVEIGERPMIPRTWELMELYPNPFNASLQIVLAGFTGDDFEITLHNLLGQVVDVIHAGALTGGTMHYQAPPWLASGVYFVKASDHNGIQTRKVVLMK